MRLLSASYSTLFLAGFAKSPTLRGVPCIFRRDEMTILAMGGGSLVGNSYLNGFFDASSKCVTRFLRGIFVTHAPFGSSGNGIRLDPILSRKFRKSVFFSIKSYKYAFFFVPLLLKRSCPSAILGGIVSIIIDSIQRCSFRTLTHIGYKVRKNRPPFAYFDAPSSISVKPFEIRVGAPLLHRRPCRVKGMFCDSHNESPVIEIKAYHKCSEIAMGGRIAKG